MLSDAEKRQIRDIHQQIKSKLTGYQPRPSQNQLVADMANIVAGSFHNYDRIGLIEAGTGTGKSMAYLLACIPLALSRKKTVVISTATVALQEQLVTKDLPFFQQVCAMPFEFSLVKGRQRYACMHRLQQQLQQADFFQPESPAQLAQLAEQWKTRQWLGDRDSLSQAVSDTLWYGIAADNVHCPRHHPLHRNCPFHLARQEIEQSQVLVVNHALLLADLASGPTVLPPLEDCVVIIDEAHHLADVGRDFFAASAQLDLDQGLLDERLQKLTKALLPLLDAGEYKAVLQLSDALAALFSALKPIQRELMQQLSGQSEKRFADALLPELWQRQADELTLQSGKAQSALEQLIDALNEHSGAGRIRGNLLAPIQQDLVYLLQKMTDQQNLWSAWSQPQLKQATQARWLAQHHEHVYGHSCPLSVMLQLEDLLFSQAHAVLLCSATLRTLNSFDSIKRELGLFGHEGLQEVVVSSPFAYQEKGLIHIPQMDSDPTQDAFTPELIRKLPQYLLPEQGNLVLFASYWQMEQVATALREQGYSLLVQGEAGRQSLLDLHKMKIEAGQGSILFGTQSFSEGLDLPGKLLTNLIITKLPFAVPTSPLEEAMAEAIEKRGGNAFLQLTVPATARKLVQACGRLLRQEQDQGRITILDRRLVTKSYGSAMLNALPPFQRQID